MSLDITQKEVDAVASFVEAVGELDLEPFFGKDEQFSTSGSREHKTIFRLGDRFHFRSALISFRRIWMPTEPSHWKTVAQILTRSGVPREILTQASSQAEQIQQYVSGPDPYLNKEVEGTRIIDLWLNTVFAHGGIEGRNKRADFEALSDKYGQGRFEYAFRLLIKWTGEMFQLLSKNAAKPALEVFNERFSLQPSFRIGSAFGTKRKEVTKEGDLIIRQASSEHFSEETFEQRFTRILKRRPFDNLNFIIKNLDKNLVDVIKAIFASTSLGEFLERLNGKLEVSSDPVDPKILDEGFCASCTVHSGYLVIHGGAMISRQGTVRTTQSAVGALDSQFTNFKHEFLTE